MSLKAFQSAAEIYGGNSLADGNESQYAKVDWICVRKHRFSASLFNVKAGFWCLKCKKEEEREEVTAYAKEIIDLNGGKCLTTKKFGFKDIISVQCGFGHKWAIQAERVFYGSWCKVCDKERKVSEFLDRLHASGWKIIGGKDVDLDTIVKFSCNKGHIFSKKIYTFNMHYNCIKCTAIEIKSSYDRRVKELIQQNRGTHISGTYVTGMSRYKVKCIEGHLFEISAFTVLQGRWCLKCYYNQIRKERKIPIIYYQRIANEKGGKLLTTDKQFETEWPTLKLKCSKNHVWKTNASNIRAGHWCPRNECYNITPKPAWSRVKYDDYKKVAEKYGGKLLSAPEEVINGNSLLKWECKSGHVFEILGVRVKAGKWCKICYYENKRSNVLIKYKKWASKRGITLLTSSVTDSLVKAKLAWKCQYGHEWQSTVPNMKIKKVCSQCREDEVNKKHLLEVKKIANTKGGECVSTTYLNNHTHLEFRCKNNHTFFANANNIKSGWWCKKCSRAPNVTIEVFQELAKSKGGELISTQFINRDKLMEWKCKEGHTFQLAGRSVKRNNKWCPVCTDGKKIKIRPSGHKVSYTIADMQLLADKHNGFCLSKVYKGSFYNWQWQCESGHIWEARAAKIKMGSWCKICRYKENAIARRLPLSDVKYLISEQGGKLLSTESTYFLNFPQIKIRCAIGHEWETNIKYIKYGSWCPVCHYETISKKTRLPFSHYQKLVKDKGGKILSEEVEYENSRSTITIKCKKGHVFNKICSLLQEGKWCLECE
ncbi:MAG: hypothetical protein KBH11_09710 [Bacteroidia bacterium]|nr:hypothetical protein [Bacteroidia bacterium]